MEGLPESAPWRTILPLKDRKGKMRPVGFDGAHDVKDVAKLVMGTHKGIKSQAWERIRTLYGFSPEARAHGAGSVSEFVAEWLV